MISMKEYFGTTTMNDVPMKHKQNAEELLKKVNILREAWGRPQTVTSGYRTLTEHQRIYDTINSKREHSGLPRISIPMGSQHLQALAVDLYDPDLSFTRWLKENDSARLHAVGLYAEEGNSNWCHLQMNPPKSQKRWFLP